MDRTISGAGLLDASNLHILAYTKVYGHFVCNWPGEQMRLLPILATGLVLSLLSACSPLKAIDKFVPKSGYKLKADIPYGSGYRQKLDIYLPASQLKSDSVIVFLYGGSWRKGAKRDYRFVGQMLASQGYAVVIPDYRLYPDVTFPGFVEDAAAAIRWIYKNRVGVSEPLKKIVLMGHSAGAHSAALLALDRSYLENVGVPKTVLSGWVGLSGPYAFDPSKFTRIRPIFATARPPEAARPINFVKGDAPPALLVHGEQDWTVSIRNSIELRKRLQQVGSKVRYVALPETGHGDILLGLAEPFQSNSRLLGDIVEFIRFLDTSVVSRNSEP